LGAGFFATVFFTGFLVAALAVVFFALMVSTSLKLICYSDVSYFIQKSN
jgi:hypothetical protein